MRMPNGEHAWVPREKIDRYLLDETHPKGGGKAVLFRDLLGITPENRDVLELALLDAAAIQEASPLGRTEFGDKWAVEFEMTSARGSYTVFSVWIVSDTDPRPKLVTAYVR